MSLPRRQLLLALAVLGAGAGMIRVLFDPFRSVPDEVRRVLRRHFGEEVAAADSAARFIADYSAKVLADAEREGLPPRHQLEADALLALFQSSNILAVVEGRAERLSYDKLFDPLRTPCTNQLASSG
jgi:hypothetical protein